MILIYSLIAISVLSLAVFLFPVRAKHSYIAALVILAAVVTGGVALDVLAGGGKWLASISQTGLDFGQMDFLIFGPMQVAVDRLSALFMLIASVSAVSVVIYARGYLANYLSEKSPAQISLHYFSLLLLYVSMIMVTVCRDAYGFLFSWELMTISSFVLMLFDAGRREVRRAALSYLVMMHVGFVFLLSGFAVLGGEGLSPGFDSLRQWFAMHNPVPLFLVFFVGFGMKAGVFPLHTWLPEAHPAAPSHISAFMSGVMIKMGLYGVLRVISYMDQGLLAVGIIIFVMGILTGLWGAILAAVQNDIKRLLAYSSMENIGMIFTAVGASAIGYATGNIFLAVCAMAGALMHAVNHSLFKTLLFFGAGNVYTAAHTTSLDALGGLSRRMPITAALFLVGVMAISALPALNGFVGEYLIYYGLFETVAGAGGGIIASIFGIVVLSLIGGVVILAFTKLYGVTFLGSPRSHAVDHAAEVGSSRIVGCAIPVAGILLIGLAPMLFTGGIFSVAGEVVGVADVSGYYGRLDPQIWRVSSAALLLIAVVALLLLYRRLKLRQRKVERSPVWGCGFGAASHKMQYSGESYSEGLYGISTSLTKNSGSGEVVDKNEIFPTPHSFDLRHKDKVSTIFSQRLAEIVVRVNLRVLRMSTGKVNHYILYALMFLVLILLLSIVNLV